MYLAPVSKEYCQGNVLNSQWTDYEIETWAQKLCRRRREKKKSRGKEKVADIIFSFSFS